MSLPVILASAALVFLVVAIARFVVVLDETELALRRLVSGVRSVRRAVEGAGNYAASVGQTAVAGEEALTNLADLKRTGRAAAGGSVGPHRPAADNGADVGTGPVSLVIRPHPVPRTPPAGPKKPTP